MDNIFGNIHDINKEDLSVNQYDIVVTNMTMHHINNIEDFIFKLAHSLKVGGKLFIADLYKEDGTFHSDNTDVVHFGFSEEEIYQAFHCLLPKSLIRKVLKKTLNIGLKNDK